MGYEIDFMAVGDGSSGGDAIVLRYGDLAASRDEWTVIVVDGGYKKSGQALVDHIVNVYGTNKVNIVVSTHPDQDHISGLEIVLEQLDVDYLLMHQPWRHSEVVEEARAAGFVTIEAASEKVAKSLQEMSTLEEIAQAKGVPIVEPFAGVQTKDGCFRVLGPTLEYYEELLPQIVSAPTTRQRVAEALRALKAKALELLDETLHIETLRDDGVTRPSNNSSVISLLNVDGRKSLLTGDAGIPALEAAATALEAEGFVPGDLQFVQVPHHGSRRNVGPTVLNRLLGSTVVENPTKTAFISAPPDNLEHKHPSKKVSNAFTRRGYTVHATQGQAKWHHHLSPSREGYVTSTPLPFYNKVEDDTDS